MLLRCSYLCIEIMGALATVVIISTGGALLIIIAVMQIIQGVFDVDSTIMLIIAILGIIIDVAYAPFNYNALVIEKLKT